MTQLHIQFCLPRYPSLAILNRKQNQNSVRPAPVAVLLRQPRIQHQLPVPIHYRFLSYVLHPQISFVELVFTFTILYLVPFYAISVWQYLGVTVFSYFPTF